MLNLSFPVENFTQAIAYINRIEGGILNAKAVDDGTESAVWSGQTSQVIVTVQTAERFAEVAAELVAEEYIV